MEKNNKLSKVIECSHLLMKQTKHVIIQKRGVCRLVLSSTGSSTNEVVRTSGVEKI